ncbi:kinase-like domain-containing protein [Cadophora sp. MPI-SDFR-AT-0126]|nr:kinase-like domain-containing protein [Leotiomycetes sp. MPI-SDFR-AT-0126]
MAAPVVKTRDEIQTEVFEWLNTTRYASTSLAPLAGGSANFIYKATLTSPLEDGSIEVVVKHGESYMAVAPANKISISRCNIEAECFKTLANFSTIKAIESHGSQADGKLCAIVRTPRLYHYDDSKHTQIMEYLARSANLKSWIYSHLNSNTSLELKPQCHALGKAIGEFVAAFHNNTDAKLRQTLKGNSQMQGLKHMINYDWMLDRVAQFPDIFEDAKGTFTEVKDMALRELENERHLKVTHGDLCPGNILITDAPLQELSSAKTPVIITDWEQAQLGSPSLDHGEMLGELFAFYLYKNFDTCLWIARGYVEGLGELDEEQKWRNALQIGVHLLAFGPIAGWVAEDERGQKEKERVVKISKDLVVNAWEKKTEWFKDGDGKVFGFLIWRGG